MGWSVTLSLSCFLAVWGLLLLSMPLRVTGVTVAEKAANLESVKGSFYTWVNRVQQHHTATVTYQSQYSSSSSPTLFVGNGGYTTVQSAVDACPSDGTRTVIQISSGNYFEKINVPSGKVITFQGIDYPVLAYDDTAGSAGSTAKSASVAIEADFFFATGVVFMNTAPAPAGGAVDKQAVALRIAGDEATFYNCQFYGAQDTLYDEKGRHYFKDCFIQGSIDFIFGDGQSLYEGCTLNSIAAPGQGSLTAQKRTGNENTGFSFVGCSITGTGPIYLGRAWGPNSRVVFIYCNIANIITPAGWYDWGVSSREQTVFYGEYQCTGPGANRSGRVSWSQELTSSEAAAFSSLSFIDGASWVQA